MASEDKTYCGQGERDADPRDQATIEMLKSRLGVSAQDVLDAISQVGHDPKKLESFFRDKENSY